MQLRVSFWEYLVPVIEIPRHLISERHDMTSGGGNDASLGATFVCNCSLSPRASHPVACVT